MQHGDARSLASELSTTVMRCLADGQMTPLGAMEALTATLTETLGHAGEIRHLAPQAEMTRCALLDSLDQARTQIAQAPVVDIWGLIAALDTVVKFHQAKEACP